MKKEIKPKIYISGKISGLNIDEAKAMFKDACDFVEETMNGKAIKTFDLNSQDEKLEWVDYMRVDIKALVDCDSILMLPNWKDSEGAKLELVIAQGLKMNIYYI